MKTDYLDLWQIHGVGTMEEVDTIFGPGGAIEAFEAAKRSGKCRFIGFTGHRDPAVHLEMLKRYQSRKMETSQTNAHAEERAYRESKKGS